MYSEESVFSRFGAAPPHPGSASNFVVVLFDAESGVWRYDRNGRFAVFGPRASDVLVAGVDFTADEVVMLAGRGSSVFEGVQVVTANQWNGQPNVGEFGLTGSWLCR